MLHAFDENKKTTFFNGLKRMIDSQNIGLEKLKYFVINMPTKSIIELITEELASWEYTQRFTVQ